MPPVPGLPDGRTPVLLTSHHRELLAEDAAAILRYLELDPSIAAVAATLLRTRRIRKHRAVLRAADPQELADGLHALITGDEHPLLARSSTAVASRTAFVFPGQGNQWPSMGADAYEHLPVYRAEADKCARAFVAAGAGSPVEYLTGPATGNAEVEWPQVQRQAAQFTHAVALARLWQSCGVLPDLTVGHSLGEVGAAYIAGAIALSDAVGIITARAAVIDGLAGDFGMAVLGITVPEARELVASIPGWLELSVINTESSVVVSGERAAIAEAVARQSARGAFVREIAVDFPAHTTALEPLRDDLMARLPASSFTDTAVEFIGSVHGDAVAPGTDFARYWYENLRNTVRFDRAVHTARSRDAGTFVELSPHPTLLVALDDLVGEDALTFSSSRRDQPLREHLAASIAATAVADPGYRWSDLVEHDGPPLRGFPNAPMRSTHLWISREPPAPESEPVLTVTSESWLLTDVSAPAQETSVAVVASPGADSEVVAQLGEAIRCHPFARPADPSDPSDPSDPGAADIVAVVAPAVTDSDALVDLVGSRLLDYASGDSSRLWLITAAAEQPRPHDPAPAPAQAALAAMHRSIGFEHPERTFAHLDLPDWRVDHSTARVAVGALLTDLAEVALRDGTQLYARTLALRADTAAPLPPPLARSVFDSVVITGGSGALGLRFAQHCAEHGAREIVLLSRRGTDPATLRRLGSGGAQVSAPACDITDADSLTAVAEHAAKATLLIHAAGTAQFAPAHELTADALRNTLDAKVNGLHRFLEQWPLAADCHIALCSSVSAVWGGYGHAAYSAANRLLDATAARLRADGYDCVSVRSGLWQGAAIVDEHEITRIERSGLLPMPAEAAADACLRGYRGDPLIFAADHARLRVLLGAGEDAPRDDHQSRRAPTADVVRAELAATLNLSPSPIDLDAALIDLGLDSLLALDLRQRLRRATGRSVRLATLLGGITAADLITAVEKMEEAVRD